MTTKAEVNRIRRMARRRGGFVLMKSLRRDELAPDYDKFMLLKDGVIVLGEGFTCTLDQVEAYLSSPKKRKSADARRRPRLLRRSKRKTKRKSKTKK
jgi:hypothetical protein